jgi:hypothetical protein
LLTDPEALKLCAVEPGAPPVGMVRLIVVFASP